MYLQELSLKNFRSFHQVTIPICKDLTILVGENSGGKSNAIDAIRLLTTPLGGRRELYCETTDIRFGSAERKFALTATSMPLSRFFALLNRACYAKSDTACAAELLLIPVMALALAAWAFGPARTKRRRGSS